MKSRPVEKGCAQVDFSYPGDSPVRGGAEGSFEGMKKLLEKEVAARLEAESAFREGRREIQETQRELDDVSAALRVLLRHMEEDREEMEKSILSNVKTSILPYVEMLWNTPLAESQKRLLEEIEKHLRDLVSPFIRGISCGHLGLSPHEIQVAALIEEGRSTKEISNLLNISPHTVVSYRYCIRKKTGIKGRKINLRTYLQGLKE